jgi:hypothetical protein
VITLVPAATPETVTNEPAFATVALSSAAETTVIVLFAAFAGTKLTVNVVFAPIATEPEVGVTVILSTSIDFFSTILNVSECLNLLEASGGIPTPILTEEGRVIFRIPIRNIN